MTETTSKPLLTSFIELRIKDPNSETFEGDTIETFRSKVLRLLGVHPNLSVRQIVASEFAPEAVLIPVAELSQHLGFAVNFNGDPKIESERLDGRPNRRFFIIKQDVDPTHAYVYEITGLCDPTRGWYSTESSSRGPKSYLDCKTTTAQKTYLTNYHSNRYFTSEVTEECIDLIKFVDPTHGFDWRPADSTTVRRKSGTRRFSWKEPIGLAVDDMLTTRRRTLCMKNTNDVSKNVELFESIRYIDHLANSSYLFTIKTRPDKSAVRWEFWNECCSVRIDCSTIYQITCKDRI